MTPATAVAPVAVEVRSPDSRGFAVAFTPDRLHVARMRRITVAHLRLWKVSGTLSENIVLAVSELVSNAIQHGRGHVGLEIRCTLDELRINVTDGNPTPAALRCAGPVDETGRGLFLVAVFAQDWGVSDDGMTTWCTFRLPAGRTW
ncbi:ATP-binding protein [Streptomyces sp. 35G-GA-8]|uniref:ATP-binding protein n=1 Tax=Streptomyces sp. 35G-GA-8 TaxID=2939434 RepID=UPI00201F840D|nr:ATP-binding protein [Streptomyces sp. 35G-GA-8]MCL7376998.1 ATP-binding protein [Streptomyces sp. 35G-GA-8]